MTRNAQYPVDLLDLTDPYITPAGVTPEWVTRLRDAATAPTCGHGWWWWRHGRCETCGNAELRDVPNLGSLYTAP